MARPTPASPGLQALKTQRTRTRLIEATLGLIRERGFSAATASNIARRAGITWGAAQHQFGSKEEILEAILALAYRRYLEAMAAPGLGGGSRRRRARELVDRMWRHYQGDHYRVSLEILRATRGARAHRARAWEQRQGRAHLRVVRHLFPDSPLTDARLREALTFTHCCLAGLSMEPVFEVRVRHIDRHLNRIASMLADMLGHR
ncbi:MAG: TetR/AcrR family transcriptional regulator [Proteobacteria bacterium]|nr:TetR/AcrR family transcriptional regulator [Pseudomonadota bacterium]